MTLNKPIIRVDPADGTDGQPRFYTSLKPALKYAVQQVRKGIDDPDYGSQAYVSSTDIDFKSLNVFRNISSSKVIADYYKDDGTIGYYDLGDL